MIVLLDNYDSFGHNLARYLEQLGERVVVIRNDATDVPSLLGLEPTHIVLSPGPCTPEEAGISVELVRACATSTPLLGVCLGHQCVGAAFGAKIIRADPVHGKISRVEHESKDLFAGIPSPLTATRYHSLVVDPSTLPAALVPTAWTSGHVLMGLRHRTSPVWGVQFHPEAVLTEHGHALLRNFLALGREQPPPGLAPGLPAPESPVLPPTGPPHA
ncbi:MAG: aminodeoxychorismate/anthranilate synthase component II [Gemmatimonadetes bacterium]|nr:aminodeoxychorismate/anthranilate synthase component II [Gemmatimonadota bacterium]